MSASPVSAQEETVTLRLDADPAIALDAGATYWVVFDMDNMPDNNGLNIVATQSSDEDPAADLGLPCAVPGFTIGDTSLVRGDGTVPWYSIDFLR